MEVNSSGKGARCDVDHSARLLARLFDMLNTAADTCDVTFVVSDSWSALSVDDDVANSHPLRRAPEEARTRPIGNGSPEERDRSDESRGGSIEGRAFGECDDSKRPEAATAATARHSGDDVGEDTAGVTAGAGAGVAGKEHEEDASGPPTADVINTLETPAAANKAASTTAVSATSRPPAADKRNTDQRRSGSGSSGMNTKEFRCHRILFASCSEYFRALLYGGMSESQTRRVELRDVAPEGFDAIVRYVYTGKVVVDSDNVMDIFSLAHRFGMGELLRACAEVLDQSMNCDDVCRVLEAAEYYGHAELATKCWHLIKENTPRVMKSESFLDLPRPLLLTLVEEGELQVDEAELFKAVQAWVSKNSSKRGHHVEELSRHFRLPLMSLRELMSVVRPSGVVSAEAILDAVAYHADPRHWSGSPSMVRPRGKRFRWDASSLAAGTWTADENRTVTTSVGDWVGVYGDRQMRSGFHRWSIRANKVGRTERTSGWGAIIGVARPQSQNPSRPYLPITGFITGTGDSKFGGNTAVDDYASISVADGDEVTVIYDADAGALTFSVNGVSLGQAYTGISAPVVAALGVNAAGAMWEMLDWGGDNVDGGA